MTIPFAESAERLLAETDEAAAGFTTRRARAMIASMKT
jgi:hypothetical protein